MKEATGWGSLPVLGNQVGVRAIGVPRQPSGRVGL